MKKKINLTYKIFFSTGIIMFLIAGYLYYKSVKFRKSAYKTNGEVIELVSHQDSDNRTTMYAPKVSYFVDGIEHFYTSNSSSSNPSLNEGDKIIVYYDPKNANNVELQGIEFYLGILILGGIGLVFALIGIIPLYLRKRRNEKNEWLKINGQKIKAHFEGISLNNSYQVNGRSPYNVNAQFLDIKNNKVYTFKSENIWFDPTPFIQNIDTVNVIIASNNDFKKYFMDISFLPQEG